MRIAEGTRDRFREPLGRLIPDAQITQEGMLRELGQSATITVGDATTQRILGYGITPFLQIVDGLEKRARREPPGAGHSTTIRCVNPAGGITSDAINAIDAALASITPTRILVDGEEDLLVLPICSRAPDGTTVLYGQPNEGLVIVRVSSRVRDKANLLLDMMDRA